MEDTQKKIRKLEEKLAEYKKIYLEKKKVFRGVSHENSLAELRYTQFMVYRDLVLGLEKEIKEMKQSMGDQGK